MLHWGNIVTSGEYTVQHNNMWAAVERSGEIYCPEVQSILPEVEKN